MKLSSSYWRNPQLITGAIPIPPNPSTAAARHGSFSSEHSLARRTSCETSMTTLTLWKL